MAASRRPRTSQPQQVALLDTGNLLSAGLVLAVPKFGPVTLYDATGKKVTYTASNGTAGQANTTEGVGLAIDNPARAYHTATGLPSLVSNAPFSIAWTSQTTGLYASTGYLFLPSNASGSFWIGWTSTYLFFRATRGTTNGEWRVSATPSDTAPHTWAISFDGTNAPLIYRDGVPQTVTQATAPVGSATGNTSFTLWNYSSGFYQVWGQHLEMRAWNRTLSEAETRSASLSPWQVYARPRRFFTAGVSGGLDVQTIYSPASAVGYTANVDRQTSITTTYSAASAVGYSSNVDRQLSVATSYTPANAVGYGANVDIQLGITTAYSSASADGYLADIQFGSALNINTTYGIASAIGYSANIDKQLDILAGYGTANAVGYQANISLGPIASPQTGGIGHGGKRRPDIVIVEVDGTEYRVPLSKLDGFLESIKSTEKPRKKAKRRKDRNPVLSDLSENAQITLKSAPEEVKQVVRAEIDRTNELLIKLLEIRQIDDEEEAILWMLAA